MLTHGFVTQLCWSTEEIESVASRDRSLILAYVLYYHFMLKLDPVFKFAFIVSLFLTSLYPGTILALRLLDFSGTSRISATAMSHIRMV